MFCTLIQNNFSIIIQCDVLDFHFTFCCSGLNCSFNENYKASLIYLRGTTCTIGGIQIFFCSAVFINNLDKFASWESEIQCWTHGNSFCSSFSLIKWKDKTKITTLSTTMTTCQTNLLKYFGKPRCIYRTVIISILTFLGYVILTFLGRWIRHCFS